MSAGEKLKALDESAQGPQTFGPEPQEWQTAAETVMVALPQIVAVVEAAENRNALRGDLDRALAALEEALS